MKKNTKAIPSKPKLKTRVSALERVQKNIMDWIVEQKLKPGDLLPSQADIARKLKTSPRTVHQAMSHWVRQGLIQRRPGAGSTLIRLPGQIGENLEPMPPTPKSAKRVNSIQIILIGSEADREPDNWTTPWLAFRAAEKALRHDYADEGATISAVTCRNLKQLRKVVQQSGAEGILVLWADDEQGSDAIRRCRYEVANLGIPAVHLLTCATGVFGLSNVVSPDHTAMGALAARHLIEMGHTHLGVASSSTELNFEALRHDGFNGIAETFTPSRIKVDSLSQPKEKKHLPWDKVGKQAFDTWAQTPASQRPTGIFCINDSVALGFIQASTTAGVRCPEDISILGVDNFVDLYMPQNVHLTSIDQQFEEMGRAAAQELTRLIAEGTHANACAIRIRPRLIQRATTGPALRPKKSTLAK